MEINEVLRDNVVSMKLLNEYNGQQIRIYELNEVADLMKYAIDRYVKIYSSAQTADNTIYEVNGVMVSAKDIAEAIDKYNAVYNDTEIKTITNKGSLIL